MRKLKSILWYNKRPLRAHISNNTMNEFIKNKHKRPWLLLDHATGVTDKSKNVRDDRSERRCRVGHVIVSASELPYMYLKPLQKLKGVGTGEAKKSSQWPGVFYWIHKISTSRALNFSVSYLTWFNPFWFMVYLLYQTSKSRANIEKRNVTKPSNRTWALVEISDL